MLVCHCRVVSDREIRRAIACGAADDCAIAQACGAGTGCGGCVPVIRELLEDHRGGAPVGHGDQALPQGELARPQGIGALG